MVKKILVIQILVLFTFCKDNSSTINDLVFENEKLVNDTILEKNNSETDYSFDGELESNEELITKIDFKTWEGEYNQVFDYTDNEYNEYNFHSKINLIKPDSSYFEYWYEIKESNSNDKKNHTKIFGKIYPSSENNTKIQFSENKMIIGDSPEQSPVFTLINKQNTYFILSFLTSPPHNGTIEMPVVKK